MQTNDNAIDSENYRNRKWIVCVAPMRYSFKQGANTIFGVFGDLICMLCVHKCEWEWMYCWALIRQLEWSVPYHSIRTTRTQFIPTNISMLTNLAYCHRLHCCRFVCNASDNDNSRNICWFSAPFLSLSLSIIIKLVKNTRSSCHKHDLFCISIC